MSHYIDRPFTDGTQFGVTVAQVLVLKTPGYVDVPVVHVQHKTFSVMCIVDDRDGKIYPLACKSGSFSEAQNMFSMLNTKGAYKTVMDAYRAENMRVHVRLSNQVYNTLIMGE